MNPRRVLKAIAQKTHEQVAFLKMGEKLRLLMEVLTAFTALFKEMQFIARDRAQLVY